MNGTILASASLVYECLGTGHSEIVYHKALEVELRTRGVCYESKVALPIIYRGLTVGYGEADLIVYSEEDIALGNPGIVVELKAVTYAPREAERAQLRGYLRSRGYPNSCGLLINFRQPTATNAAADEIDWCEVRASDQEGIGVVASTEKNAQPDDDQ